MTDHDAAGRLPGRGFSRRLLLGAGLALPAILRGGKALAQNWPSAPIRFINPGPAGGAGDVLARLICERLGARLGQVVVVEDRPGAGTNVGMAVVARAPADGYTLGLASIASNAVNKTLYKHLPFDPEKDFAPISMVALVPNLMVVSPKLPVTTVQEFIDYGKKHPGEINYGSVGAGSSQHLVGAQFGLETGIEMMHVPYTNSGQLNTDLIEGRVQVLFQSISAVAEMAKAGKMRALGVTGTERQPAFPDVPTLQQAGVNITATGWFGFCAPSGVPEPILERLNTEVVAILKDPEMQARIIALGSIPKPSTRAEMAGFMADETARWAKLITTIGASVD